MKELIAVNYETERPTVSGRELHEALEVKTAYKDWFPRMCEYGFAEGEDFNSLIFERVREEGGRKVSREITDHQLTIPMAKEIYVLQRNDKGNGARAFRSKRAYREEPKRSNNGCVYNNGYRTRADIFC